MSLLNFINTESVNKPEIPYDSIKSSRITENMYKEYLKEYKLNNKKANPGRRRGTKRVNMTHDEKVNKVLMCNVNTKFNTSIKANTLNVKYLAKLAVNLAFESNPGISNFQVAELLGISERTLYRIKI